VTKNRIVGYMFVSWVLGSFTTVDFIDGDLLQGGLKLGVFVVWVALTMTEPYPKDPS